MITIITVNYNAYDFLKLMIESLELFSDYKNQLIVIDNSEVIENINFKNTFQFPMPNNIGHGRGLNHGVSKAYELFPESEFIMFLDVDCHILRHHWENDFLKLIENYDIIGGKGVPHKPIRPSCMFMRKKIGKYDWCDTTGYKGHRKTPEGFDVAIKAYYQMSSEEVKIKLINSEKNHYGTINGENWIINNLPTVYHHWSGTYLKERQSDFPETDLFEDKKKLFSRIPWRTL